MVLLSIHYYNYTYYIYHHFKLDVRLLHTFAGDGNEKEDEKFILKTINF